MHVTYPDDHAVLTSGREVESTPVPGGKRRSRFTAEGIEGFAVNLAPGFELYEVKVGDVAVVAMLPPDDREAFRKAAQNTADAVAWYQKVYGFFPVDQIGLAPGERHPVGGWPLPRAFLIHRGFIDDDFLRWITAHELGHYYWGLHVLADDPDRPDWLTLANGIWADQLYLARLSTAPWPSSGGGGARVTPSATTSWPSPATTTRPSGSPRRSSVRLYGVRGLEGRVHAEHRRVGSTTSRFAGPPRILSDLEIELRMADGTALHHTLGVDGFQEAREQALEVRHDARLLEVRLDPNGVLLMVNGTHPRIRRAALQALDRVHQDGLFFDLVPAYLEQTPEDEDMRFRLGRRLAMGGLPRRRARGVAVLGRRGRGAVFDAPPVRGRPPARRHAGPSRPRRRRPGATHPPAGARGARRLEWRWRQVNAIVDGARDALRWR